MKLFVFSSRKFQLVMKYKTTVPTVLLVTLSPWTLTKTCISNIAELLLFVSSPQNCPLTSFNIILWPFLSQVVSTLVLVTCVESLSIAYCTVSFWNEVHWKGGDFDTLYQAVGDCLNSIIMLDGVFLSAHWTVQRMWLHALYKRCFFIFLFFYLLTCINRAGNFSRPASCIWD